MRLRHRFGHGLCSRRYNGLRGWGRVAVLETHAGQQFVGHGRHLGHGGHHLAGLHGHVEAFDAGFQGAGVHFLALGLGRLDVGAQLGELGLVLHVALLVGLVLLGLLLRVQGFVRVRLAGGRPNPLDHGGLVRDVGQLEHHIQHGKHHARRHVGNLAQQFHHLLERGLRQVLLPRLLTDDELALEGRDGVEHLPGHRVRLVDADVLALLALARDAEHLGLVVELLDQADGQVALDLAGQQHVVEQFSGQQSALLGLLAQRHTRLGVAVAVQVLVADARCVADHLLVDLGQLQVALGYVVVAVALDLGNAAVVQHHKPVRRLQLVAHLLGSHDLRVDGALLDHGLVGREHKQALADALVQAILWAAHRANRAIRGAVFGPAVGPHRDKWELVVLVRAGHVQQDVALGEHGAAHLHPHPVGGMRADTHGFCGRLTVPALDDQHALTLVAAPCVAVVAGPLARHQGGHVDLGNRGAVPPLEVAVFGVGRDASPLQGLLLLRKPRLRHVQVHGLEAELVGAVVQIQPVGQAVVQHVAPRLEAFEDGLVLGVRRYAHLHPAQPSLETLVGGLAALKLHPVDFGQVLEQVLLGLGRFLGLFAVVVAANHMEVDARAALGADQPVHQRLDLVVNHRVLPASAQFGFFGFGVLLAVVVVLVQRHLKPVVLLAAQFLVEPTQQLGQQVLLAFGGGLDAALCGGAAGLCHGQSSFSPTTRSRWSLTVTSISLVSPLAAAFSARGAGGIISRSGM